MRSFALLAALLPALAAARIGRRSNCISPPAPVTFNLQLYTPGTNQPTGVYLGANPDPETPKTAPDGSPVYFGYATSALPSTPMFQLAGTTWSLTGGVAFAHQFTSTFDLVYFANAANAVNLPELSCSFNGNRLVCSSPDIVDGTFALCGNDLAFYDGVSPTGCPQVLTDYLLYKV